MLLGIRRDAASNVQAVAVPLGRVGDDLVKQLGEVVFLRSALWVTKPPTSRIVPMYTVLELLKHRKVVSPRFWRLVTARFMAGCCG